jgi:hypothetical protein
MARGRASAKNEKLSRKEKQELRKESQIMREKIRTIVLPTFGVIFLLLVVYVFLKTRTYSGIAETYDEY